MKFINIFYFSEEYEWKDHIGNPGLLHSPCLETNIDQNLSAKLVVYYLDREPIVFTCTCKCIFFICF